MSQNYDQLVAAVNACRDIRTRMAEFAAELLTSEKQGTTPADGATVTEVPELSMRFDDPMRIITVTLTSPDGTVDIERETGMIVSTIDKSMSEADITQAIESATA